jgi:HEXXH motif-containing protein
MTTQSELLALGFTPDSARAAGLNRRLAQGLGESLTALAQAARIRFDAPADAVIGLCAVIATLDAADPRLFATYFDLMDAARREDRADLAHLWDRLGAQPLAAPAFHARRWGDPAISPQEHDALLRAFNADPTTNVAPTPATPQAYARTCATLDQTMELMRHAAPELDEEIRELVRLLIFADCDDAAGVKFDGATSLHCAGALLLNIHHGETVVAMADGLAHESGHALLFAAGLGAPLVVNGLGERFGSPLRTEPRPLEGVFHAAYVSARRAYVLDRLLSSDLLDGSQTDEALEAWRSAHAAFRSGMKTVDAHAELTPLGAQMIEDARAYMAQSLA